MGDASPKVDTVDPLIGRVINDRFEILELIARGGMGRVYKARQQPLGREVALKVLDPRHQGELDPEFQARFFLEASTSAKLSHPNTVTVFDYGKTNDDIYFIVMELVEGRTLAAMLKDEAPIDPERAVHIAVQIARSLREAHGIGVIHRDLKPANVLLARHADETDFVKVLDFGLVKNVAEDDELTQAGLFMGSPKYMAPEQIQGGMVDGRTDVYALGVMLYLMLTGRVPFDRPNQVQILMAHMREAVPPITRDDGVPVPPSLQQVVLRCLAKDADARFANMNELINALKHAGSAMGASIQVSGAYSLSDMDLSGMRSVVGTPGSGIPVVAGTPSGGLRMPASGLEDIDIVEIDEEYPKKSKTGLYVGLAALVLVAGGAAVALSSSDADTPQVAATAPVAATPTATRPVEPSQPVVAPPAQPTTPTAPETAEPPPARVIINLHSEPDGAEVFVGDRAYGTTPASVEWVGEQAEAGQEVTFRFVRAGYRPASVTRVISDETLDVTAELTPIRRVAPRSHMSSSMDSAPAVNTPIVHNNNFRDNPY
jgi:serine/threonine-protein kinase